MKILILIFLIFGVHPLSSAQVLNVGIEKPKPPVPPKFPGKPVNPPPVAAPPTDRCSIDPHGYHCMAQTFKGQILPLKPFSLDHLGDWKVEVFAIHPDFEIDPGVLFSPSHFKVLNKADQSMVGPIVIDFDQVKVGSSADHYTHLPVDQSGEYRLLKPKVKIKNFGKMGRTLVNQWGYFHDGYNNKLDREKEVFQPQAYRNLMSGAYSTIISRKIHRIAECVVFVRNVNEGRNSEPKFVDHLNCRLSQELDGRLINRGYLGASRR